MIEARKFKVGDRVIIHTGILLNCGDGVVVARHPHGYLAIRLNGTNHVAKVLESRVEFRLDTPRNPCNA